MLVRHTMGKLPLFLELVLFFSPKVDCVTMSNSVKFAIFC